MTQGEVFTIRKKEEADGALKLIGIKLREARINKTKSVKEVAGETHVSTGAIHEIEEGKGIFRFRQIFVLSHYYQLEFKMELFPSGKELKAGNGKPNPANEK